VVAQVLRVLPRVNDDVNEEWIVRTRRATMCECAGAHRRLDRPYVRKKRQARAGRFHGKRRLLTVAKAAPGKWM
jgi:NADH dehydrogenase/NADH:ubiquinone oxidoreductase subunit G